MLDVSEVTLREITAETVRAVCALEVAPEQRSCYVPGDDGPAGFHRGYGCVETGEFDEGEAVIRLEL